MQLGSMFISNCNNALHALSAEAIDLGRPYWILHPVPCHTPKAATTVSKCSWGWTQKASETCRVLLQLLKHTAKLHHDGSLYILTYDARNLKHKILPTDFHVPRDSVFCYRQQTNVLKKGFTDIMLLFYILKHYLNRTCVIITHKFPGNISGSQSISG